MISVHKTELKTVHLQVNQVFEKCYKLSHPLSIHQQTETLLLYTNAVFKILNLN